MVPADQAARTLRRGMILSAAARILAPWNLPGSGCRSGVERDSMDAGRTLVVVMVIAVLTQVLARAGVLGEVPETIIVVICALIEVPLIVHLLWRWTTGRRS